MEIAGAGIQAFCLFSDGGTTYELDGSYIDPGSNIRTEKITRANGKGGQRVVAKRFVVEINHADATLHSQMESAAHGSVQWKAQAVGFAYNMMCLEVSTFAVESQVLADPSSEDYPFTITYEVVGQKIGAGLDLILAYRKTQGQGELTQGATNVTVDIPFAFEDIPLTLSNDATGIEIQALDSGDVSLSTVSTTTGSGRVNAKLTTPANTFTARCIIDDVQDPALRVDGKTTYPN